MKLKDLIKDIPIVSSAGDLDRQVTGICQDSRQFKAGDLFIAVKGEKFDGHDFVSTACAQGASGVVVQSPEKVAGTFSGGVVVVASTHDLVGVLAAKYFKSPDEKLFLAGVTGTNGKTTTTYMIEGLLGSGVIGTIDSHFKESIKAATHTTPDPIAIQRTFAEWVEEGAKSVAMEVSSHGLAQARVDHLNFDVAVFTNLTRDHLDFHQTMDAYVTAKGRLFKELLPRSTKKHKRAIINEEDPYSTHVRPNDVPVWTFGFSSGDLQVLNHKLSFDGTEFSVQTPVGILHGHLQMVGKHNMANALGALGVAFHKGLSLKEAEKKISEFSGVPGRLQRVPTSAGIRVFVDYAHTDDGLVSVLTFLKQMRDELSPQSKIITVFGCGGDRDRGKRPLMMKAALEGSDFVVVTSDNPRTEDPNAIIKDILKGTPNSAASKFAVDADRRTAIQLAIGRAISGDVILIAGKGHENYQIIGDKKIPFDDFKVTKELLNR